MAAGDLAQILQLVEVLLDEDLAQLDIALSGQGVQPSDSCDDQVERRDNGTALT